LNPNVRYKFILSGAGKVSADTNGSEKSEFLDKKAQPSTMVRLNTLKWLNLPPIPFGKFGR